VFGGLGQDDIIGGNSSFFSLGGQMIQISGVPALAGMTWQVQRIFCQGLTGPCGTGSVNDTLELGASIPITTTTGSTMTVTGTISVVGRPDIAPVTGTFVVGNSSIGGTIQLVGFDWRAAGFDDGANLRPDVSDLLVGGSGELTARNEDTNGGPNPNDNGG